MLQGLWMTEYSPNQDFILSSGQNIPLLQQVQNWLSTVKMIDEEMSSYSWKIHCSITDPQLKRLLHSGGAP